MRIARRAAFIGVILAVIFALNLANGNLQDSIQDMLIQAGIAITLAVSLNIVNGFTGQFSIGHAGFMAVGAYAGGALCFPRWVSGKKATYAANPTLGEAPVLSTFTSSHSWLLPAPLLLRRAAVTDFRCAVRG